MYIQSAATMKPKTALPSSRMSKRSHDGRQSASREGHAWLCSLLTGGPWMLIQRAERVVANDSRSHASCSEAADSRETMRARPCVRMKKHQRWHLGAPHGDVAR